MPWKEVSTMSSREEFIRKSKVEGSNISELCRQYGISRKTGYKWIKRYREEGEAGLKNQSRRPEESPRKSTASTEGEVLAVREAHPAWGGRKIRAHLEREGKNNLPSASTITEILRRYGQLNAAEAHKHRAFLRFEMEEPNELWQMDFKGYFGLEGGSYCHPLTVLDDHSRFLVGLRACADETSQTVQEQLTGVFRTYGLPQRMLMDNGSPWGDEAATPYTILSAWLLRLDILVCHGRPYHPQTQGKDERLHRTLKAELLSRSPLANLNDCQVQFDRWREMYNTQRPHEALQMQSPASRYQASARAFPETLPPIIYADDDIVRKVDETGTISFNGRAFRVGKAFRHTPVALRPTLTDGEYDVFFCKYKISRINLRNRHS